MTVAVLDLAAIQGIVLRGYRMPVGSFVFLTFDEAASGRSWVGAAIDPVTSAAPWEAKPDTTVNVAFSASGLRALGVSEGSMESFATAFLQGMAARSVGLGDTGDSAAEQWEFGHGTADIHAVVLLAALSNELLATANAWLAGSLPAGVREVHRQEVGLLATGREHFGYADGFSQPDIEGVDGQKTGQGAYQPNGGWRSLRAGEVVFGYPDEENILPIGPQPEQLARNGSYLVVRKLAQDVAGFRAQLASLSQLTGLSEELLAAKFVGRWRDGTPLAVSPGAEAPAVAADPIRANAFDYDDDRNGYKCPVGAHVRRANPRLSMPFDGKLVNRHRIVRRGLPYGPPLLEGAPDDGVDRGVMFACFQADIERQFEFVQSQWVDDGNTFGLGEDKDVILGNHQPGDKFVVNGSPPALCAPLQRVVRVRGGEYFFAPGINGLTYLNGLG